MTVTMLMVINGDVEISASCGVTSANVVTLFLIRKSAPLIIAALTPTAQRAKARSHVPEARC